MTNWRRIIAVTAIALLGSVLTDAAGLSSMIGQKHFTGDRPKMSSSFRRLGLQSGSPWPKLQGNIANSGQGTGAGSNGLLKWTIPGIVSYWSAPAVAADGTVYVSVTSDRKTSSLLALNPVDGSQEWSFPTGATNAIQATPAIGADGTIYAPGFGSGALNSDPVHLLFALKPDGTQKWVFGGFGDGGYYLVEGAPTIAKDGTIYFSAQEFVNNLGFGVNQNYLFALNPDGSMKWDFQAGQDFVIQSTPAIGSDGTIYFGTWDGIDNAMTGKIFAVNPKDGSLKWSLPTLGQIVSSPAIGPDGTIYIGEQAGSNKFHALNPDGTEKWTFSPGGSFTLSPAVDSSGTVYVTVDSVLYSLAPDGTQNWSKIGFNCSPAIGADNTLYVGSENYRLYALNPNGTEVWDYLALGQIYSSFAIGADGTVYFGEILGNFYAIGTGVPAPNGYNLSPSSVIGGSSSTGTVTIKSAAPPGGEVITLKSSDPSAIVPASISIPAGATQGTVTIRTTPVSSQTAVTLTATADGVSVTTTLTVLPPALNGLTLSPTSVGGGGSSTGTVTLNGVAPTGGATINLASNNANASTPANVVVPAGATSTTFSITTLAFATAKTATITATQGSVTESATLSINPLSLLSLALHPATVIGGSTSTGTVTLNAPAEAGGAVVKLSSSLAAVATTPTSITIPAGQSSATFTVKTSAVSTQKVTTIRAMFKTEPVTSALTVNPPTLTSFSLDPPAVTGGMSSGGSVTLSGPAPAGGIIVKLESNQSAATVPPAVIVGAGKSSATFSVKTVAVTAQTSATITASLNGVSQSAPLTINSAVLASLTLNPSSVKSGSNSTGTVTLTGPAPAKGLVITLSSNQSQATPPETVTVAAGRTAATFTIKTKAASDQVIAMISASLGAVTKTANLTVK